MMAHVVDCLKDFVTEFNLDVSKKADKYGFHLEFENKNDWLYISYATHHPYDHPFFFDVVSGDKKQFCEAIEQAKKDWSALLICAEFENPDAHHSWANAML